MKSDRQSKKRAQIREAAADLLREKGYGATSMLSVARRARASNETLYRWYGNKQGLFREMVSENARSVATMLSSAIEGANDPLAALDEVAPALLSMVIGESAVALNRAAVADAHETATLGPTIAAAGRDTVVPLIVALMDRALAERRIRNVTAQDAAEVFVALLIGDWQIRRAIGVLEPPEPDAVAARAAWAMAHFRRLFAAP